MQARTAGRTAVESVPVTVVDLPAAGPTAEPEVAREGAGVPAGRVRSRARPRATPRPTPLSRAEEYRYIRSDLRRLLITAGGLGVAMLALLLVLEV